MGHKSGGGIVGVLLWCNIVGRYKVGSIWCMICLLVIDQVV